MNLNDIAEEIFSFSKSVVSADKWAIPFSGNLTPISRKTIAGMAYSNGDISLHSSYFKELTESSILEIKHVLIHEFSHLIVGLNHGHDKHFKRVLDFLTDKSGLPENPKDRPYASSNIKSKYSLIAHFDDGSDFFVGNFHRKTKVTQMYLDYPHNYLVKVDGVERKASRFELVINY